MYTGTDTAVPIPLTTRGIGIHAAIYYNYYKAAAQNDNKCTAAQLYRISLLQLDTKMQINCKDDLILDDEVEITTPLTFSHGFDERKNFRLISRAINSLGNFALDDASYEPYIPEMDEVDCEEGGNSARSSPLSVEFFDCYTTPNPTLEYDEDERQRRIVPNPYLITIHNLRQVVVSMSNPNTPLAERKRFIHRNPIPSAVFVDNLLTNPDDIMPERYDDEAIGRDMVAFRKMMHEMKTFDMVERVDYEHHGNIAILSCVHHPIEELFAIKNGRLDYSGQSTVRAVGPKDSAYKFNGCCYLMSEYPMDLLIKSFSAGAVWALRSTYLSNSSYVTSWTSAINNYELTHEAFEEGELKAQRQAEEAQFYYTGQDLNFM